MAVVVAERLIGFVAALYRAAGLPEADAALVADSLVLSLIHITEPTSLVHSSGMA